MKRALLITGGTLGSLAAVFAITPPQIASNQNSLALGGGTTPTATPTTAAPAPSASTSTAKATKPATTPTKAAPSKAAPTKAATTPTPSKQAISGTFVGDISSTGPYGGVITSITVASGKITDVQVLQAPGGQSQGYTNRAIPTMRQRALAAQSAQISAVSGASYTSYNFWKSLTSAIAKAGL